MVPFLMPLSFLMLILVVFVLLYFTLPKRRKIDLNMKHVVVTGGSKGIGRELAFCFIEKGCNVSIIARNEADLKKAHRDLQCAADSRGQQQKVLWYSLDLSRNFDEIKDVFDRIEHELGPIHVLINNAGTIVQGAFDDLPLSAFEDQISLNYYTAVYPTRCVISGMKDRGFGHISFVSSAAGQFAIWGYSSYSASKFALRGLADALQMELLPYNISVSILCPPNTDTDVFKSFHTTTMPVIMRKMTAVAGIVSPEEVARAHVTDIENGNYLTTNGLMGWFLGVGTAGSSPEKSTLQAFAQIALAGPVRGALLVIIGYFNALSKSYALSGKNQRERSKTKVC
ncbi:hypothetical protein RB195_001982 [Necator americanus]|uniref:3-dehydrosphinganine reductase n=2 Tax=Necator americanus TaxID=51031 RepID=A0ABR1DIA2_NECAM